MKKLRSKAGLTVIEMLAAVAVLVMLTLVVGAGLTMAIRTYESMIAQNEAELLLSSAVDAIADELRYARDVDGTTYNSDSFGDGVNLMVAETGSKWAGQIVARKSGSPDMPLLSTGAYGKVEDAYKKYLVTLDIKNITSDGSEDNPTFTIKLKVQAEKDSAISAETPPDGVTVRCLNPSKEVTLNPEEGEGI